MTEKRAHSLGYAFKKKMLYALLPLSMATGCASDNAKKEPWTTADTAIAFGLAAAGICGIALIARPRKRKRGYGSSSSSSSDDGFTFFGWFSSSDDNTSSGSHSVFGGGSFGGGGSSGGWDGDSDSGGDGGGDGGGDFKDPKMVKKQRELRF